MTVSGPFGMPSPWVVRHACHIRPGGRVLDLACGYGRNAAWLAKQSYRVEAVDRDATALSALAALPGVYPLMADLEAAPWPYPGQRFDGIVVSRYLHRPLLPLLAESLAFGGVLIYETFMVGHERHGKPSNPDFLLKPDELMQVYGPLLAICAFEQGEEHIPRPAVMQRICAIRHPEEAI
ncbi:MAG: methyltransferase domain-containing protein [Methylophilaceae bacterium]|nr:methyltransferase domain-containing protein [Methylophilaceae bacterium]